MKVEVSREDFSEKLGAVARAVSSRASVQILSGVLLRAEAGRLQLAATDMELSLRSSVEANVSDEGVVVVPGRLLVELVRLLPGKFRAGSASENGWAKLAHLAFQNYIQFVLKTRA